MVLFCLIIIGALGPVGVVIEKEHTILHPLLEDSNIKENSVINHWNGLAIS